MADQPDFDLDRSIAQSWALFAARLAEVLSMMDESADLTLGRVDAPTADLIRFTCSAGRVTATTRVDPTSEDGRTLERRGWEPIDGALTRSAPQEDTATLADAAVDALQSVHGVLHPVFLAPDQLSDILDVGSNASPPEPTLDDLDEAAAGSETGRTLDGVRRRPVPVRDAGHLGDLVGDELESMFGYRPMRDSEGDFCIRWGSTMVFLHAAADARDVVIFAPVVHDLEGRSRAAEVLGDLNGELSRVKFTLHRDRVFATMTVMADPFVPTHLHRAVGLLGEVADGIDGHLAAKLHGRTTFEDGE